MREFILDSFGGFLFWVLVIVLVSLGGMGITSAWRRLRAWSLGQWAMLRRLRCAWRGYHAIEVVASPQFAEYSFVPTTDGSEVLAVVTVSCGACGLEERHVVPFAFLEQLQAHEVGAGK